MGILTGQRVQNIPANGDIECESRGQVMIGFSPAVRVEREGVSDIDPTSKLSLTPTI